MTEQLIDQMMQTGVAGLMGVLWLWERWMSRTREQQLTQSHEHMMRQREELKVLTELIERNTRTIEGFDKTQTRLCEMLDHWRDRQGSATPQD